MFVFNIQAVCFSETLDPVCQSAVLYPRRPEHCESLISQAKHVIGFTFWNCVAQMAYLAVVRFTHVRMHVTFKIQNLHDVGISQILWIMMSHRDFIL